MSVNNVIKKKVAKNPIIITLKDNALHHIYHRNIYVID